MRITVSFILETMQERGEIFYNTEEIEPVNLYPANMV